MAIVPYEALAFYFNLWLHSSLVLLTWITNELSRHPTFKGHAEFANLRGSIKEIVEEHSTKVLEFCTSYLIKNDNNQKIRGCHIYFNMP